MQSTSEIGKWAEDIAVQFLTGKSFQILFRNWRAGRGDIDIIALAGKCMVFVEVKGGNSKVFGPPEWRITTGKKQQLYKLASIFLAEVDQDQFPHDHYRFDVVIVDGYPNRYEIRHYENAFYL